MIIRRINDTTIRFIITQEDLEENQINLDDLLEHKPQAMNYLRSIITQAVQEEDFRIEGPFTTMQIRVLRDNSISLTLTQGLESNLLQELRRVAGRVQESSPIPGQESEGICPLCAESLQAQSGSGASERDNAAVPEQRDVLPGFLFDSLSDAAAACRSVPDSAQLASDLYRDEMQGDCYLFFPAGQDGIPLEKTLSAMSEFGTFLELSLPSAAYLMEHTTCILKGNAAQQLSRL